MLLDVTGALECCIRSDRGEGAQTAVESLDALEVVRDELGGRHFAAAQPVELFLSGEVMEFEHIFQPRS